MRTPHPPSQAVPRATSLFFLGVVVGSPFRGTRVSMKLAPRRGSPDKGPGFSSSWQIPESLLHRSAESLRHLRSTSPAIDRLSLGTSDRCELAAEVPIAE